MVRYFTHMYPFGSNLQRNPGCLGVVKGRLMPYIKQKRQFADKDKGKDKDPAKEEQMTVKMPGFVHPENMKEEGFFAQKARKELEELKRKPENPASVDTPDKKL